VTRVARGIAYFATTHGYAKFFPLWALARYRNLNSVNARAVAWGM
jgi:squalene-hopene/tetraprenyl-beta-curcumene cyclase